MKTEYEGKSTEELAALLEERDSALEKAEADKTATVGELKELRTKKQEVEEELEQAKQAKTEEKPAEETSTADEVERVLKERDAKEAKENRENALEQFRASHHEFTEAADPGGVKFAAFERELAKFNLDGLKTADDFTSRFKEVHQFMNRGQAPADDNNPAPHPGSPQDTGGGAPPAGDEHDLDATEKKLLQQTGWTKERYLALKEKQPQFVESQLALVN